MRRGLGAVAAALLLAVLVPGAAVARGSAPSRGATTGPVVTTELVPSVVFAANHVFRYVATDSGSAINGYDIRYRFATRDSTLSPYYEPPQWRGTRATAVDYNLAKGETLCLSVRATDKAGNISPWSRGVCQSRMIDDRALVASAGWTRDTSSADYLGTDTQTTVAGATLTSHVVTARTVAIAATTVPGGGRISVSLGGTQLGVIGLAATAEHHRVIVKFRAAEVLTGQLVITTLDAGASVIIDGFAVRPH